MPVHSGPTDAAAELRGLAERIVAVSENLDADGARSELDSIAAEIRIAITRYFGTRKRAAFGEGASTKILMHLTTRLGEWVDGQELAAISGIQEWARRVRELRLENGYDIEEHAGSYRLLDPDPSVELSAKWKRANTIRRLPGSARDRILEFLIAEVTQVVTRNQLDYVGNIKEGTRRVRELRDEHGWPIESHIDVAFLTPGQYRLVSADPADRRDPRQRLYPENLRHRVFERDGFTCQDCGRNQERATAAGDSRFYLEVHHKTAIAEELDALPPDQLNEPTNLVTFCHSCHSRETAQFQRKRRIDRTAKFKNHDD